MIYKKELKADSKILIFQTILFYSSLSVLIAAGLLRYDPSDGDAFKNEYISFFLIYINFILAKKYFNNLNFLNVFIFLIFLIICVFNNFIPISCIIFS